jgi:hypothetical protein
MHNTEKLEESVTALFQVLSDSTRIVKINQGWPISVNKMPDAECFLIHDGCVFVRRTDDRVILGKICSPTLFGFNQFQDLSDKVYLEAVTPVAFEIIPASQFFGRIRQHQLWEPLLDVMMNTSSTLFQQNHAFAARDSWGLVREHLLSLIKEPEFIRSNISVVDYILHRTHLSRSGVMKLLATLRKRQLIKMESGLLLNVGALPKTLS